MRAVSLGDVIDVDRAIASEDECQTMPYVGLEHIEKECGRFSDDFRPMPEHVLATKFRFTPEHVLYGKLRPYLNKVALPHFKGVCTTEILPLLPKPDKLERGFLYAVLLSPRFVSWASQNVSGANLPRLGPDRLLEYEFHLPDLTEQKRIAAILERADRLRRLRRHALEMAESILAGIFKLIFGDPIRNEKAFPKERLEDLIHRTRPITYGILKPGPHVPNGVPYVRVVDIQNQTVLAQGVRRTTPEIDQAYKRSRLKPGDLLLSIRGHVGRMGIVPPPLDGANITQDTARLAPIESLDSTYLMGCLSSTPMQHLMGTLTRGAAVQGINLGDVKELPIPVPPLPLQEKFAKIVEHHTGTTAIHREALRQAEHLFGTLLHRAFTSGL